MRSNTVGISTSPEVTNVSKHGIWVLWGEKEYFLDFGNFPWFRDATIAQITHVTAQSPTHLYWPDLDVDLSTSSIDKPEAYPLISKG